jgi:hypothetical protein
MHKITCIFNFVFLSMATFAQGQNLVKFAKLHEAGSPGLTAIQENFREKNPGYDLFYLSSTQEVPAKAITQVLFVQQGGGTAVISNGEGTKTKFKGVHRRYCNVGERRKNGGRQPFGVIGVYCS